MNPITRTAPDATTFLLIAPAEIVAVICTCGDVTFCRLCADDQAETDGIERDLQLAGTAGAVVLGLSEAFAAGYGLGIQGTEAAPPHDLDGLAYAAFDAGVQDGLKDFAAALQTPPDVSERDRQWLASRCQDGATGWHTTAPTPLDVLVPPADWDALLDAAERAGWQGDGLRIPAGLESWEVDELQTTWLSGRRQRDEDEAEIRQTSHNPTWAIGGGW